MKSCLRMGAVALSFLLVSGMSSCSKKSSPTGPVVNLGDSTVLQGTWLGTDQGADTYTWAYIFAGNSLVIQRDSVTLDSGVYSIDTLVTPHTMSIQIIKADSVSNSGTPVPIVSETGKTINTIYQVNTSGSFILMYVLMNAPGVSSPDSASDVAAGSTNDSLLILRSQSNIGG
ncbi:MAG: hypothetical protein ABSE00_01375 [Chitinispirillaceae bacterium]|jgi:hypothetical protein